MHHILLELFLHVVRVRYANFPPPATLLHPPEGAPSPCSSDIGDRGFDFLFNARIQMTWAPTRDSCKGGRGSCADGHRIRTVR